jgi:hypothetical protein
VKIHSIRFRQSGGFSGLVRGCEAALETLDSGERRALESHFSSGTVAASTGASPARDLVVYEIEADTDSGATRIEFDEMNVPGNLAALVERLAKVSRPIKP